MQVGFDDYIGGVGAGAVVVVGEIHGTTEIPALVGQFVGRLRAAGRAVGVALELPSDGQAALKEVLASGGDAECVEQLLAGKAWHAGDGRGSQAMLALILALGRLGLDATYVRFVDASAADYDLTAPASSRDRAMATGVLQLARSNIEGVTVFLCGNVHAWCHGDLPIVVEPGYRTAAALIAAGHDDVTCLNVIHGGGAAWNQTRQGAGVHPVGGVDRGASPFVELRRAGGYDGEIYLPGITPSPPARDA